MSEIIASPKMPEPLVRKHLAEAVHACLKTQYRLIRLRQLPTAETHWKNGPELTWFFAYSEKKVEKLLHIFQHTTDVLRSPDLKIVCKEKFDPYGLATPGIRRIKLGMAWANGDDFERTQTLIHEATHIAGRFVFDEGRWYGPDNARRLARWAYRRPMRPTRSADNLGYYAMDCLIGGTAGIFASALFTPHRWITPP